MCKVVTLVSSLIYSVLLAYHTSHSMHHTAHITMHTSHCTHHTAHITLQTSQCTHHTAHITLPASHCTHHTARIILHTSYCIPQNLWWHSNNGLFNFYVFINVAHLPYYYNIAVWWYFSGTKKYLVMHSHDLLYSKVKNNLLWSTLHNILVRIGVLQHNKVIFSAF